MYNDNFWLRGYTKRAHVSGPQKVEKEVPKRTLEPYLPRADSSGFNAAEHHNV